MSGDELSNGITFRAPPVVRLKNAHFPDLWWRARLMNDVVGDPEETTEDPSSVTLMKRKYCLSPNNRCCSYFQAMWALNAWHYSWKSPLNEGKLFCRLPNTARMGDERLMPNIRQKPWPYHTSCGMELRIHTWSVISEVSFFVAV